METGGVTSLQVSKSHNSKVVVKEKRLQWVKQFILDSILDSNLVTALPAQNCLFLSIDYVGFLRCLV